jgi:hypothetical protein
MAGEWVVMARAGATKEPTINPRIASIARTRVVADHRSMTHNLQQGAEMARWRKRVAAAG